MDKRSVTDGVATVKVDDVNCFYKTPSTANVSVDEEAGLEAYARYIKGGRACRNRQKVS